jgi:radical SAM peptide maturase (CXXX-repeat target family)
MNKLGIRASFTVSIDGNKELHDSARIFPDGRGSYDLAFDAACHYEKKYKTDLGSKMTIAPSNIIFLFPAVKHYLNQGKREIFANCVYEEGWTYEDATLFYNELKKLADYMLEYYPNSFVSLFDDRIFEPMDENDDQNWCGGNGLMLASDPDGVLYPCLRYMPSSIGDKQPILTCGHVDTGIDTALLKEMQKITRRSQSTDECFYCPIAKGCSWCTAYNYEVFGTINKRATFICPMHKARALANVYYWNKYYKLKNIDKVKINYCPKEWALEIIDENEYEMLNNLALR